MDALGEPVCSEFLMGFEGPQGTASIVLLASQQPAGMGLLLTQGFWVCPCADILPAGARVRFRRVGDSGGVAAFRVCVFNPHLTFSEWIWVYIPSAL